MLSAGTMRQKRREFERGNPLCERIIPWFSSSRLSLAQGKCASQTLRLGMQCLGEDCAAGLACVAERQQDTEIHETLRNVRNCQEKKV